MQREQVADVDRQRQLRSIRWAAPVVVLDAEQRPVLAIGSPGGRRIPMILTQVLVRWRLHDQSLEDAVEAPRFHVEDTEVEVEEPLAPEVDDAIRALGYDGPSRPEPPYYWGSMQALEIDHDAGEVRGATDPRRAGDWRADRP